MSCCGGCFEGLKPSPVAGAAARAISRQDGTALEHQKRLSAQKSQDFHGGLDFISKVPLLKSLPMHEYPRLVKIFQLKEYASGATIIKQGDLGDRFFCIKSGKAKVIIDGIQMNTLKAGDYFGELALLRDAPRNATIVADGPLECQEISRADFDALDLRKKLKFPKRKAMAQNDDEETQRRASSKTQAATVPKTPAQAALIQEAMRINTNIGGFVADLKPEDFAAVIDEAYLKEATAATVEVITQGDLNADLFYIIEQGTGEAIKDGVKVASYKAKDSFGGLALLYQAPRAATVRVTVGTKLWCVPRGAFRRVLQSQVKKTVEQYAQILSNVKCLDHVSNSDKNTLADALVETTYYKDQFIFTEGDNSDSFFILKSGDLSVSQGGQQVTTYNVQEGKELPHFGDRALIYDELSTHSVRVTSPKASLLVLGRSIYLQVVRPKVTQFSSEGGVGIVKYSRKDLKFVALLGCGGFGRVSLEEDPATKRIFAVKSLSKGHVVKEGQELCIMNEKKILNMTCSPFLVQCAATFNSKEHLCFLLEPALGGELYTIYIQNGFHGDVKQGMFYSACVLRGLQHLHERSIIYRDMKPENLLLDARGYCKITDFGLAKFVIGKTFTICGTPDYFCPELLKGTGHTQALDYWCLGVLIYELLMGAPPFESDDPGKLFAKMMQGIEKARWPRNASNANWPDLVQQLCRIDPSERLAVRAGGSENVVTHRWYASAGFDWGALTSRTMTPPWDPDVKKMDGSNFDANEDDAPPECPYKDPGSGWDADFENVWGPAEFA